MAKPRELVEAERDVVRALTEEELKLSGRLHSSFGGTISVKRIKGKEYKYLARRTGKRVATLYIPKDLLEKVDRELKQAKPLRARLSYVRSVLRQFGEEHMDVLSILKEICEAFSEQELLYEGLLVVGSVCMNIYSEHYEAPLPLFTTRDVDIAIEHPYRGKSAKLITALRNRGFEVSWSYPEGVMTLRKGPFQVEFLTVAKRGEEKPVRIRKLEVVAQALNFLNLLFRNPVLFNFQGYSVVAPHPVDFVIHKVLVAQKRPEEEKREKDMEQAEWVYLNVVEPRYKEMFEHVLDGIPQKQGKTVRDFVGSLGHRKT